MKYTISIVEFYIGYTCTTGIVYFTIVVFDGSPSSYLLHTQRGWLHISITCSPSLVAAQAALGILRACDVSWLHQG
jgi:hypothetical protein